MRLAVTVVRRLPEDTPYDDEWMDRLTDGSWLVRAGHYRRNDINAALAGIDDAITQLELGLHPLLKAHGDARGLRWTSARNFEPLRRQRQRDSVIDCDYERAIAFPGVWVPLDQLQQAEVDDPRWRKTLEAIDEAIRNAPEPQPRIARNIVVLAKPPLVMHPELTHVDSLGDGTALLIGKRSSAWVEWLKRTVPLETVRLIPGPVDVDDVRCHPDFEGLLEAHAEGRLVMRVLAPTPGQAPK